MIPIATIAGAAPMAAAVFGAGIAAIIALFLIPLLYGLMVRRTGSPIGGTRRLDAKMRRERPAG